ncbi:hypothetical protein PSACC_02835 [Paramicrosporidium saccamoebae]|uniref:tRNA synthetases class I catalytic domain-containing protein n=1 Tax=Paramicrosporidium saccamoebae TaxID=1246581 RepID=A0A2H9TI70_9FUNG|nr:hypothetical protein PSACC_02835 [Paramicrosporidium saccamoebae]
MNLQEYLNSLPEWMDEQRSRSLFSSFSQPRSVNPESFDSKLLFWKEHMLNATRLGLCDNSVFRLPDSSLVAKLFSRNGNRPLGVAYVMSEHRDSLGEASLLSKLAKLVITGPLTLSWHWVSGTDAADNDVPETECADLVSRANGEQKKDQLLRAISFQEFCSIVQESRSRAGWSKINDKRDFELLLKYMRKTNMIAVASSSNLENCAVKIRLPGETRAPIITPEEANIVKLKNIITSLDDQLHMLALKIKDSKEAAIAALKTNDRSLALHELRRSKTIESSRNQRLQASSTIHEILLKIADAHSDVQIYEAYKTGESTLKQILARDDLSVSKVDNVVVLLQEAFIQQGEISAALGQPNGMLDSSDEDLEKELEEMIQTTAPSATIPERGDLVFPSVPLEKQINKNDFFVCRAAGPMRFPSLFQVYNSLTKKVETLQTSTKGVLNWTYMTFDIMKRILKHYGMEVRVSMGITDVDDKIISQAARTNETIHELSRRFELEFIEGLESLNFSRVSEHMDDIIHFIARLLEDGYAYKSPDGSIHFSISRYTEKGYSYPKFRPSSACNETKVSAATKADRRDFALWKPAKPGEPYWDSPWGLGRPGWHIECSSISTGVYDALSVHSPAELRMLFILHKYGDSLEYSENKMALAARKLKERDGFRLWTKKCFWPCQVELCRDFNWSKVIGPIFVDITKRLTAYIDNYGDEAHPLVLMHAIDELGSMLGLFGFSQQALQSSRLESGLVIDEAIKFRSRVRALGLSQMKEGNMEASQQTLQLCDEFRVNLGTCGISVKVQSIYY